MKPNIGTILFREDLGFSWLTKYVNASFEFDSITK